MRAIDADELIVQFRRAIETFLPNDPRKHMDLVDSLKCHGWEQGLIVIQKAPTIQPEPHWIPVTERLPEVSGCYLVSVKNDHKRRYSKTAWFEKGVWFARQDVIAWMPLPEHYKEVTE